MKRVFESVDSLKHAFNKHLKDKFTEKTEEAKNTIGHIIKINGVSYKPLLSSRNSFIKDEDGTIIVIYKKCVGFEPLKK